MKSPALAVECRRPWTPSLSFRPIATRASDRRSAHLVGICGSGMKSLAALLLDLGWSISGSDMNPTESCLEWLRTRGVNVHKGHAPQHIPWGAELVIYSAAVAAENPERVAARALGIPERSYSQILGELMRSRRGIGIAGTHGKSTTAAMTAAVLRSAGREPSACIGAELCGLGTGGWQGRGDLFVAECCEFRRSFLDLSPTYAAILNVEPDHFDYFQNLAETREAFRQFAARVPREGLLVVRGGLPERRLRRHRSSARAHLAGASRNVFASQRRQRGWPRTCGRLPEGIGFDVVYRREVVGRFTLRVPGTAQRAQCAGGDRLVSWNRLGICRDSGGAG